MPRRGTRKPRPGDPTDPEGFALRRAQFEDWLQVAHYSAQTIHDRGQQLDVFIGWCAERGLTRPVQVTRPILERYQRHVYHYRKKDGHPLSGMTQLMRLVAVRVFFRWLTRQHYLLHNPASELELPRLGNPLPKAILTAAEADQICNQCDVGDPLGLRDRAIVETLYSTGMRRQEVIQLTLSDVDLERGTVMIREGKGKKDRLIPIGARALAWLEKYLTEGRPSLAGEPDEGTVFLLQREGRPLTAHWLSARVRRYVKAAQLGKTGSCHLFRHTMATLMLENGADIRFIQAMLGHADLSSTQIYTHVAIRKLKEIHTATHPARLTRDATPPGDPDGEAVAG